MEKFRTQLSQTQRTVRSKCIRIERGQEMSKTKQSLHTSCAEDYDVYFK